MTKVIGVTGGIGSGKTTVCRIFESLNLPVFYADEVAKMLYDEDFQLQRGVMALFGEDIFSGGCLNKARLAKIVFEDKEKLQALNALAHPAVKKKFKSWLASQKSSIVIKEAAILIESGGLDDYHAIVLVTAPLEIKIQRIVARDQSSEEDVLSRMKNQMTDEDKLPFVQHVIDNSEKSMLIPQVLSLVSNWREN